ncbi:serine phosphatase RsbU (regulator of sigma subunit) [Crenobacter luteus]|uniref:Protein-serine/threonine phosphatase n=1 Tax=Crenobacter luteus TaxID=1452487 RepID=A0A161SJL3_9NEIS|nr:SpoIIE family protein phosphatase [Crenobacter luteus]KZE34300.1 protein-serine/threonine phosphatase [Crenobacter luteus]TCP15171.1 serine phosphatase RsbU (regulator of sigma subunit) [Crenobacter luteus]
MPLDTPEPRAAAHVAGDLLQSPPTVSPAHSNYQVLELFSADASLSNLPVVDDKRPVGIINRNTFMSTIARPFHREIFGRKPCTAFMNAAPLVVDYHTPLTELSFQALSAGESVLSDGFLVTVDGDYAGLGQGVSLMQALADQQAEKHRQMMDSIHYASVIQQSFLQSSRRDMAAALTDYFMAWEPRDVVGGDYYYFVRRDDGFFVAVIDCTGHGVPGAFMTLIMASALKQVLTTRDLHDPAALLGAINRQVKESLGQLSRDELEHDDNVEIRSDDGMDCAFCWYDKATRTLTYAGAKTPIFVIEPGSDEVAVHDGNKKGVGYVSTPLDYQWENRRVTLAPGAQLYISTDGIIDQIGGPKRICFGKKRFKEALLKYRQQPMTEQRGRLLDVFHAWQGENARRDDVSLFGVRLP